MADDPRGGGSPPPSGLPDATEQPVGGGVPTPAWERADEARQPQEQPLTADDRFREHVGAKQARKLLRRKEGEHSIWFGLGMFGVVGWSVAIPTMIGVGLGYWIDRAWPGRISWTLTLMVIGLCLGSLNAWYWVQRQRRAIVERERELEEQERQLQQRDHHSGNGA
ncbi:MAG: hypothetical protein GXX83_09430 [Gaiellales bacterium]|nr:hypothetical protein [Gaiellales bacterium]